MESIVTPNLQNLPVRVHRLTVNDVYELRWDVDNYYRIPNMILVETGEKLADNDQIQAWLASHARKITDFDMQVVLSTINNRKENEWMYLDLDVAEVSLYVYNVIEHLEWTILKSVTESEFMEIWLSTSDNRGWDAVQIAQSDGTNKLTKWLQSHHLQLSDTNMTKITQFLANSDNIMIVDFLENRVPKLMCRVYNVHQEEPEK